MAINKMNRKVNLKSKTNRSVLKSNKTKKVSKTMKGGGKSVKRRVSKKQIKQSRVRTLKKRGKKMKPKRQNRIQKKEIKNKKYKTLKKKVTMVGGMEQFSDYDFFPNSDAKIFSDVYFPLNKQEFIQHLRDWQNDGSGRSYYLRGTSDPNDKTNIYLGIIEKKTQHIPKFGNITFRHSPGDGYDFVLAKDEAKIYCTKKTTKKNMFRSNIYNYQYYYEYKDKTYVSDEYKEKKSLSSILQKIINSDNGTFSIYNSKDLRNNSKLINLNNTNNIEFTEQTYNK